MNEAAPAAASNRRAGGRAARHALRSAPLAEDKRPVRPGLPGGRYTPLTEAGVVEPALPLTTTLPGTVSPMTLPTTTEHACDVRIR